MTSFWLTETSMKALMGENYEAFAFFDGTHLFWLALCAVTCVGGSLFYRKANERQRRRTLIVLTLLMLTDEILKYIVTISTGQFEWQFLTFHLCGVNIFVCLWYTIHPNKLAAEILYALCLPGAIVALLVPTWTEMPFGSFVHLHSFSIHVFLESYPWLLLAGGFRPNPKNLPKVFLFLCGACIPAVILNNTVGTNFMFLNGTENNPVLEMIYNTFGNAYVLGLILLIVIVWIVLYLPWVLAAGKRKKLVANAKNAT